MPNASLVQFLHAQSFTMTNQVIIHGAAKLPDPLALTGIT